MSDIKRGDRVKVEFEALADETYADVAYIITPFAKMPLKIHYGYLTKITPSLPTKIGAVIRHEGTNYVCDGLYWSTPARTFQSLYFVGKDFEILSEGIDA